MSKFGVIRPLKALYGMVSETKLLFLAETPKSPEYTYIYREFRAPFALFRAGSEYSRVIRASAGSALFLAGSWSLLDSLRGSPRERAPPTPPTPPLPPTGPILPPRSPQRWPEGNLESF